MPLTVTVVGAGNVGRALARRFAQGGNVVRFGVRDPSGDRAEEAVAATPGSVALAIGEAVRGADVVVLAVPLDGLTEALGNCGDLDGKVVVDAVNAVRSPAPEGFPSVAQYVASKAPGARVVKAFNCVGFEVMLDPVFPSGRAVMPIAGDDPTARAAVAALGSAAGFDVIDLGGLEAAPLIEGFARLWIRMMMSGSGRDFAFGLLKR